MAKEKLYRYCQAPTVGRFIVKNPDNGLLEEYYDNQNYLLADRFYRKIKAETDWFEKVITHRPTIGSFYEILLRNTLIEFAPTHNKIGTGFIYDPERDIHSKQIDILIYDDTDRCVLYRNKEFVVVYPGSVISAIEVKKSISSSHLKQVVKSTFFNSMGSFSNEITGVQRLHIFVYNLNSKIESLCNALTKYLEECVKELKEENIKIPVSTIVLPFIYFLDEHYTIETSIKQVSGISYKITVELHETPVPSSLGYFLSNVLKENPSKISKFETSLLSTKVRPMPKEFSVSEHILLFKKISYTHLLNYYQSEAEELQRLEINNYKPLSLFIPITENPANFKSYKDLFSLPGVMIECFNLKTREIKAFDSRMLIKNT